ncbi:MAG: GIY-YIG nuclease family protein [Rickettsiales bacterium]
MKQGFVYFMTNKKRGVIYIGVTADWVRRVFQHKQGMIEGFTKRYRCHTLVRLEAYETILEAITQEKKLKNMRRAKKIEIIERDNPDWNDLSLHQA